MSARGPLTRGRTMVRRSPDLKVDSNIRVAVRYVGPTPDVLRRVEQALSRSNALRKHLTRSRWKLLSIKLDEPVIVEKTRATAPLGQQFVATAYDYTKNRALQVSGNLRSLRRLSIAEFGAQPWPSYAEFEDAVAIIRRDRHFGPRLRQGQFQPYPPMPPLASVPGPDGRVERTLAVGLLPARGEKDHEIVGVNMTRRQVVRFENRAPATAQALRGGAAQQRSAVACLALVLLITWNPRSARLGNAPRSPFCRRAAYAW